MTLRVLACAMFCLLARAQSHDWLIVPGQRVGPITKSTSIGDLKRYFGAVNVREQPIELGEGFQDPGAMIYPDPPQRRLAVVWATDEHPLLVFVCEGLDGKLPCQWKTPQGISYNTTTQELERINGRPFQVRAWGADWGGGITSWNGGRCESLKGLDLYLDHGDTTEWPAEKKRLLRQLEGERIHSSGEPAMQRLNPRVRILRVKLP